MPACVINSPMDFSSSSIREPMSSTAKHDKIAQWHREVTPKRLSSECAHSVRVHTVRVHTVSQLCWSRLERFECTQAMQGDGAGASGRQGALRACQQGGARVGTAADALR